jgi:putative DNA primase/helicase
MMSVREAAFAAHEAGICVVPPKQDGSKVPDVDSWKAYQQRRPTFQELSRWYDDPQRTGNGAICGSISAGLELLDFDDHASAWEPFAQLVDDNGLSDVWQRVTEGYWERTPSGGYHVLFRSPNPTGAIKLAQRAKRPEEKQHPRDYWQTLIETKGEGGYAVIAPTNGAVHPSGGCYELLSGSVASIATITAEERAGLLAVARMVDQKPRPLYTPGTVGKAPADHSDRPGNQYNARTSWDDLLPRYGWALDHRRGVTAYWTRPGKDRGVSATTNYQGNDLLWVFSSSTDLDPDRSFDRFGFYALMEHGGDFREAARALAHRGYGKPATPSDQPLGTRPIRRLPPVRGRRAVIDLSSGEARHAG